ncbi:MAG: helix-hairpin-helix domain-containing protein [Bacteroidetes bacterium]|nr:helix-hairpin-helix domain-containing protein [Bacteroidota bacterium]
MGFTDKLKDFFSFTSNEKKIFLIISVIFISGSIIKLTNGYFLNSAPLIFNYSESDSIFKARSFPQIKTENHKTNKLVPHQKINLNKATKRQLMLLPGIGEVTAEKIIQFRDNEGIFKNIDDLLKVKGIGKKKLDKLKPYLVLE